MHCGLSNLLGYWAGRVAHEILFLSKINPFKKADLIKKKDYKKILINSKKVLRRAIKKGGSSIRDFKNTSGKKGGFQKNFNVYERNGLNCKRQHCNGIIQKISWWNWE